MTNSSSILIIFVWLPFVVQQLDTSCDSWQNSLPILFDKGALNLCSNIVTVFYILSSRIILALNSGNGTYELRISITPFEIPHYGHQATIHVIDNPVVNKITKYWLDFYNYVSGKQLWILFNSSRFLVDGMPVVIISGSA